MAKTGRVIFKPNRIAEGEWQIEAHCPEAGILYVTGFPDKFAIDNWMNGDGKVKWLRSQGYAK